MRDSKNLRRKRFLKRKDRLIMQGYDVIHLQKMGDSQTENKSLKKEFCNVSRLQRLIRCLKSK